MKVMIVDDSSFTRKLIKSAVTMLHPEWETVPFGDSVAALEAVEKEKPDFITLDMVMPNLTGTEFLDALTTKETEAKVIFITADIQSSTREKAEKWGVDGFIEKPISLAKLKTAFEGILK